MNIVMKLNNPEGLRQKFLGWASEKPPEERYAFNPKKKNPLHRFLTETNVPFKEAHLTFWEDTLGEHELGELLSYAIGRVPWTYGSMVNRLRERIEDERSKNGAS